VRGILESAGRGEDYVELGLGGRWQWNPLGDHNLDSSSLAYTIASLINQLYGRGKDPFWQQAYVDLVRWIIELHRMSPDRWVTLRDVYRCTLSADVFEAKIAGVAKLIEPPETVRIGSADFAVHAAALTDGRDWDNAGNDTVRTADDPRLRDQLTELDVVFTVEEPLKADPVRAEQLAAVRLWYENDWLELDQKLRSSIVKGLSVFLSVFDMPDVASVFCPPPPERELPVEETPPEGAAPPTAGVGLLRRLPDLDELIDDGKVLCLNMPAGRNPGLSRALGVMLKQAWLQTLLRRPAELARRPTREQRPAVFLCDEYQSFATVGENDPSGDEKMFALTRQSRLIPIVATQSISSLRSVLGESEAWRTLLQTLRTRIVLSLSDDASAQTASTWCGQVSRMKASYTVSEQTSRAGVSPLSGVAGGGTGSVGKSKAFSERREPLFHPRDFTVLDNYQAIVIPYDGRRTLDARRVYLKPHFLPRDRPYWRAHAAGEI
ncbi:MAG: type IV secretory system conjugative DNA transfer family protein, partial [Boseongicola sp. SB0677_bin_26]|nr:type IV secretory system conjugative DNA transfer family protein [Boseongicola sp. SB0677_bin_26]